MAILHKYRVNAKSLKDDIIIIEDDVMAPLIDMLDDENDLRMLKNVKDLFTPIIQLVKAKHNVALMMSSVLPFLFC